MKRLWWLSIAIVLVASACTGDDSSPTTTSTTTAASTTTTVPSTTTTAPDTEPVCETDSLPADRHDVDLDGAEPAEVVYLRRGGGGDDADTAPYELGVCLETDLLSSLDVEGRDLALLGFVDLDDDGRLEILFQGTTDRGTITHAATLTIRGLALTDLAAERWIEGGESPAPEGPFEAAGVECADVDDDGRLELLVVGYRPADLLVNVRVAMIGLEATTAIEFGVDSFETGVDEAFARWREPDGCAPGSTPKVGVHFAPNGWGRVDYGAAFASEGSLILTGVARGGAEDRYVVVGVEQPSPLIGEFFPLRPAVWSSADAVTWEESDLGEAVGELRAVVALPDDGGFVAVGRTLSFTAAVWLSGDGRSWELVEVGSARPGVGLVGPVMSRVLVTPLGLVAVGTEDYAPDPDGPGVDLDAAVWLSADGRSWERIEDPALGTAGYQPNAGAEFNGELAGVTYHPDIGIVAVGSASEPDPTIDFPLQFPAVWLSPDGRRWQRHDIDADARLRGVTATAGGLVVYGVSEISGSPHSDAVVLVSIDGEGWTAASGAFDGLGEVDGIQSINHAVDIPGVGVVAVGSDEKEFESVGGAAVWWSEGSSGGDLATWNRETHDDIVFETLTDTPTATMTDAIWSDDTLIVVGFSGRTIEFQSGATGCCVFGPAIWMWSAG